MDSLDDPGSSRSRRVVVALTTAWVLVVSTMLLGAAAVSSLPGRDADAPASWPTDTGLGAVAGPTLLLFAHPECPCVHATLDELLLVLEQASTRPRVVVVLAVQGAPDTRAVDGPITRLVEADLAPVQRYLDRDEQETRRFGVHTSGEVLFYAADGGLRFAGGITASRGHEGANDGAARLRSVLDGRTPERPIFDVFGCSLDEEGAWP